MRGFLWVLATVTLLTHCGRTSSSAQGSAAGEAFAMGGDASGGETESAGGGGSGTASGGLSAGGGGTGEVRGGHAGESGHEGAGEAGLGGSGGEAAAGLGAEAGVAGCAAQSPSKPLEFPHCAEQPLTGGGSFCSLEDTRTALSCGEPGSSFDSACCPRKECDEDVDCGGPRGFCIPRMVQGRFALAGGLGVETCYVECGLGCTCSAYPDNFRVSLCVFELEDLSRFDCNLDGFACEELVAYRTELLADLDDQVPSEQYGQRVNACVAKIEDALVARCG